LTQVDGETELGLKLYVDNSLFSYSDNDGIVKLYFRYTFAAQEITFLYILK